MLYRDINVIRHFFLFLVLFSFFYCHAHPGRPVPRRWSLFYVHGRFPFHHLPLRQSAPGPTRAPSKAHHRAFPTRTSDRQSAPIPSRYTSKAPYRAFPHQNPAGKARPSPPESLPRHPTALSLTRTM